jgi:zinc-ribbon domain
MQCRNCGAEIADKALICYRCGTATADAKYRPAPLRRRASRWRRPAVVLAILLLLLLAAYLLSSVR